jgi:uncharacterized protein HemY
VIVILLLILAVLLGLGMTFFANQNPAHVDIHIANFFWHGVPLYLVVALSLLLGLLIAWLFGLLSSVSSSLTIFGKDTKIKRREQEVNDLNKKVKDLEIENAKLKQQAT